MLSPAPKLTALPKRDIAKAVVLYLGYLSVGIYADTLGTPTKPITTAVKKKLMRTH